MKVSFRTTFRDLIALNFYHIFRSPIFLGFLAVVLVIGIKFNLDAIAEAADHQTLVYQIGMFIILELVPVLFIYLFMALALVLGNLGRRNKTLLTDNVLTLTEDAILSETPLSRSELKWAAVQKLARTKSHFFLYVTQQGAVVIPTRAFASEQEREQFWAYCKDKTQRPTKKR